MDTEKAFDDGRVGPIITGACFELVLAVLGYLQAGLSWVLSLITVWNMLILVVALFCSFLGWQFWIWLCDDRKLTRTTAYVNSVLAWRAVKRAFNDLWFVESVGNCISSSAFLWSST
jgi:hypothetical protein